MDGQALALDRFNSFLAQEEKHRRMGWWTLVATLAVVMLAGAIAASLWTRSRVSPSPGALLHISDLGPQLRIEWDPAREPIRAATGATLEIRDGDSPPNNLPITRDGLDSGSIVYSPRSEKIEVRLNLLHGKEPASESVPYFIINPVRSTDSRSLAPVPIMQSAPPSVASEPVSEAQSEEPIGVHTTEHESASTQMPALSAHPRKTTRAFHPPVKRPSGSANLEAKASLPDLPEIHTAQPVLSVPLPSALPIGARPPTAPMVSQTRAKDRALPASGRLIWTGDLRKNGLLSLSPSGASQGVLNGHLPGFSVKVSVQPAELVDGGIAVFSSDRTRSGASELPSARNGWNVVIYRWDPKRTSAVTIIEPPGPANGWGHLVLRNGNHNLSVLVIDWQREEGQ